MAPLTDNPDRFEELKEVFLEKESVGKAEIESARSQGDKLLLTFKGVETRESAEKLVGSFISIEREKVPELPEGSYYHFELVGMKVYSDDKQYLGEIAEVIPMPANDIWRVEGEKDYLIPATANVILEVDKVERRVIIRLLDGLIEE